MSTLAELTPSTVIDWRRQVIEWLPSQASQVMWAKDDVDPVPRALGLSRRQWTAYLMDRLAMADCYLVSAGMTEVAKAAAPTLTVVEHFGPDDLPSPHGFMVFKCAVYTESGLGGSSDDVGVAWTTGVSGVFLCPLELRDSGEWSESAPDNLREWFRWMPPVFPLPAIAVSFTDRRSRIEANAGKSDWGPYFIRLTIATWLLMAQTLSIRERATVDRAAARRAARADTGTDVSVITLRRASQHHEGTDASRDYTCQWLVRGHWRNQWHPARGVHRPIWVAPYVKGPEDKPFRTTERVYAWTR